MMETLEKVNSIFINIGAFLSTYWWIFVIIAGLLVLTVLSSVAKPIATVVAMVLKIVLWIISAPFKFVGWLFGRKKK